MPLVHGNHVIEQILAAALDPTLSDAILPGTLKRSPERSDPQRSNGLENLEPVLPISVPEHESGSRAGRKRLAELLDYPKARGVFRHIEVQDCLRWAITKKQLMTPKLMVGTVKKSIVAIASR
jgi:hypothetical protein